MSASEELEGILRAGQSAVVAVQLADLGRLGPAEPLRALDLGLVGAAWPLGGLDAAAAVGLGGRLEA
jgi:hypothetical protein